MKNQRFEASQSNDFFLNYIEDFVTDEISFRFTFSDYQKSVK